MKYLKTYKIFEDKENFYPSIQTIKDILVDFEDDYYPVSVFKIGKRGRVGLEKIGDIAIEIGDTMGNLYLLNEYESAFDHLFSYLNDMGYKIDNNLSYVLNILCPNCGSNRIADQDDIAECQKCSYNDDLSGFDMSNTHHVTQEEFEYFIKNKYWVQYIYLVLRKDF